MEGKKGDRVLYQDKEYFITHVFNHLYGALFLQYVDLEVCDPDQVYHRIELSVSVNEIKTI